MLDSMLVGAAPRSEFSQRGSHPPPGRLLACSANNQRRRHAKIANLHLIVLIRHSEKNHAKFNLFRWFVFISGTIQQTVQIRLAVLDYLC